MEDPGKAWTSVIDSYLRQKVWVPMTCPRCKRKKKHTKACIMASKKEEKARKLRQKKEEVRRNKKITMTVGEYEDKLQEARDEARGWDDDY